MHHLNMWCLITSWSSITKPPEARLLFSTQFVKINLPTCLWFALWLALLKTWPQIVRRIYHFPNLPSYYGTALEPFIDHVTTVQWLSVPANRWRHGSAATQSLLKAALISLGPSVGNCLPNHPDQRNGSEDRNNQQQCESAFSAQCLGEWSGVIQVKVNVKIKTFH